MSTTIDIDNQSVARTRLRRRHLRRARHGLATAMVVALAAAGVVVGPGATPASAAAGGTTLVGGERLNAGQHLANAGYTLHMQGDGNLVAYGPGMMALWSSSTAPASGAYAIMQTDGNLVVYSSSGRALWSAGTQGQAGNRLVMQGDGNLVVYRRDNRAAWQSNTYRQGYAVLLFPFFAWDRAQWPCLRELWQRESGWNERARNPSSGAYGIPQALPATKMATEGSDYLTNHQTQIRWGEKYIHGRYGTPCRAWSFWQANHWY